MYSTFTHEIGPTNFINVVKSTYDGGTFNNVYIPPYDYKLESEGKKSRNDRYDDMAYRLCVASGRDYTWYIQNELLWPLKQETINKIKSYGYEQVIPVQSVYGMGEVGRETGRPFYIPSTGYVFDFEKSLVSPGNTSIVNVSKPKYGDLIKREDGKYDYKVSSSMPKNAKDEFILTVKVESDGIVHETKLNCTIGIDYNSSNIEKFDITKWDIHEALEDLKTKQPYATSSSIGMKIYSDDGNNLARSNGYFVLDKPGTYEFQAFGDDRAVFELHLEDGSTLQSLTEDYSANVEDAYNMPKATNFTVKLEANKPYSYTLITNNNGGVGWADVNLREVGNNGNWKSINQVYSKLTDVGKVTDRTFEMPHPEYVRPHILASGNETIVKDIKVISTPKGVEPNNDPNSLNEGKSENIVDGDLNTYFHSSYSLDKTPLPHEYIFDLGGEKSFNHLEVYTRRTGEAVGVIGNYEIYISDEYDGDNTKWTKISEDYTRKGNTNAPSDLKISLPQTSAKYLKIKALNNRDNYELTILAEVKLSTTTNIKNVIAQNSSYIQYKGDWEKNYGGAFVSGGTYNSTSGYFMYCFEGAESNIYVAKNAEVEMRINGGKWVKKKLIGSLREPSITLNMDEIGKNTVEVRATGDEIALNMISTDGTFYKGKIPVKSNPPIINGANDITIKAGDVDVFNPLHGVSVSDDHDTIDPSSIKITGTLNKPLPGKDEVYQLKYEVTDSDRNTTTVLRNITVTNRFPEITANNVTISKGQTINLLTDGSIKLDATDHEDGNIKSKITVKSNGGLDEVNPSEGIYQVIYTVTDSDGNTSTLKRIITVNPKVVDSVSTIIEETVGSDRYNTANKISNKWTRADNIVIANSDSIVDAMTASPFAHTKGAPILLSSKSGLTPETKASIARLKAKTVYLIGGENSLDKNLEKEIIDIGVNVVRIAGQDRFETSLKIAKEIDNLSDVSQVAIVNGQKGLPDAISISSSAAINNMPIILSNNSGDIPQGKDFIKLEELSKAYVIGGNGTVSEELKNEVSDLIKNKPVKRLGGKNRTETNVLVLDEFYKSRVLNNLFVVKDGSKKEIDLIDSLSVSSLAAKENSPVMIVGENLTSEQTTFVKKKTFNKLTRVGGNGNENAFNSITSLLKN